MHGTCLVGTQGPPYATSQLVDFQRNPSGFCCCNYFCSLALRQFAHERIDNMHTNNDHGERNGSSFIYAGADTLLHVQLRCMLHSLGEHWKRDRPLRFCCSLLTLSSKEWHRKWKKDFILKEKNYFEHLNISHHNNLFTFCDTKYLCNWLYGVRTISLKTLFILTCIWQSIILFTNGH